MSYPKTYATIVRVERSAIPAASGLFPPVFTFRTDGGDTVVVRDPGKSGRTPGRCKRRRSGLRHAGIVMPFWAEESAVLAGERVKLYRRPERPDRWHYRHQGS